MIGEKESHDPLGASVGKDAFRVIRRALGKREPIGDDPVSGTKE
ncbi:MAG TPA: hypothetical protein P5177_03755 [Thermovirgaceae bacterium]|nr:hypothetical protein [Thermovirgaceae bacterium]